MSQIDTNRFPYNKIKAVTLDGGNEMVYIPKIYVKNEVESVDNKNLIKRYISNVKLDGYHCHPAFMQSGHEQKGLYISAYPYGTGGGTSYSKAGLTTQYSTLTEAKTAVENLYSQINKPCHLYNIYEHHLLALLMLIEYGTTNLQQEIGGSADAMDVEHYGIHDIWGATNYAIWLDGIKTDAEYICVFDNLGNGTWVQTAATLKSTAGYPVDIKLNTGEGYDLNDLFLGQNISSTYEEGSFGDKQDLNTVNRVFSTWAGKTGFAGPFAITTNQNTDTEAFRFCAFA